MYTPKYLYTKFYNIFIRKTQTFCKPGNAPAQAARDIAARLPCKRPGV